MTDPTQYAAVREAAGVAGREDRARIRLWGKDPVRMVQGLITNDLAGAPEGHGVYAAMLTPKGRTIADLRAFTLRRPEGVEVLIELSREALAGTTDHLRRFVPPMFAKWADASDAVRQLGVYGPRAAEVVGAALGMFVPALEEDGFVEVTWRDTPVVIAGTREIGLETGFDLFLPAEAAAELGPLLRGAAESVGGGPVGFETLETLRMEAGRPRYGAELTEEVIPTEAFEETGLMARAISFGKGCYTGQEVIVRIAHRGHVNKHLRGLVLHGPVPERGTALVNPANGREVGRVTGAADSPLMGTGIALAFVRREVEPGTTVRLGAAEGPEATVVKLPFTRP